MVYILLGTGFEEMEAVAPGDILRRGGVEVRYAGIGGDVIRGGNGVAVAADCRVEDADGAGAELVVVPGGMGGVQSILGSEAALNVLRRAWDAGKMVAAICAGPLVLTKLGILDGKNATCYPGLEGRMSGIMTQKTSTVADGRLITGRGPGAAMDFGLRLLEALRGREAADSVAAGLCYERR